jgi:hypothetical protein
MDGNHIISAIINEIGVILLGLGMIEDGRSLIYAEVKPGMYSISTFVDRGDAVHYIREPLPIEEAILDLWEAAEQDKKWRAVCYKLVGDKVQVTFDYGEGWDEEEVSFDRRERVLEEFYKDRTIVYPKID